jgi:hypothetical protein
LSISRITAVSVKNQTGKEEIIQLWEHKTLNMKSLVGDKKLNIPSI